jgi:hypothetical protein
MVKINSASDAKTKFIDIARRLARLSVPHADSGRVQRRARSPRAYAQTLQVQPARRGHEVHQPITKSRKLLTTWGANTATVNATTRKRISVNTLAHVLGSS